MNYLFTVKYEARLENGMLVSKSDQGVEFNVSDGTLSSLSIEHAFSTYCH